MFDCNTKRYVVIPEDVIFICIPSLSQFRKERVNKKLINKYSRGWRAEWGLHEICEVLTNRYVGGFGAKS